MQRRLQGLPHQRLAPTRHLSETEKSVWHAIPVKSRVSSTTLSLTVLHMRREGEHEQQQQRPTTTSTKNITLPRGALTLVATNKKMRHPHLLRALMLFLQSSQPLSVACTCAFLFLAELARRRELASLSPCTSEGLALSSEELSLVVSC